jgi:hypothetical protein
VEPQLSDDEQKVWDILNAPVPNSTLNLDDLDKAMTAWWSDTDRVAKFMESFRKRHGPKPNG